MLQHPDFDPVAFSIGPVAIHWYGLSYMVAFGLFFLLAARRTALPWFAREGWTRRDIEDLLFFGVLGVILGGRLGFVLFYDLPHYLRDPIDIVRVWRGGMSFHGGLLGVGVALAWFARSRGRPWLQVADLVAPCVPTGLASGRLGNFINGELWGREAASSLPWSMVFPRDPLHLPRHPSQLYQFALEGLLLFVLLWLYASRRERGRGQVTGAFLAGYGAFRFLVEFFREPDRDLRWLVDATGLSMGQWLCVPMMVGGLVLWWRGRPSAPAAVAAAGSAR